MTKAVDLDKACTTIWGQLMLDRQFNEAIQVSLISLRFASESKDEQLIEGANALLRRSLMEMLGIANPEDLKRENIKQACSFCGKAPPNVKLGAGYNVFICNECVSLFSGIFDRKT